MSYNEFLGYLLPPMGKGQPGGVAELNEAGMIPASQLPSYVDDVLEYDNFTDFPEEGETGKIYVDKTSGSSYRWSGSIYVLVATVSLNSTASGPYSYAEGFETLSSSTASHS